MKKTTLLFILSLIFFSCKKEEKKITNVPQNKSKKIQKKASKNKTETAIFLNYNDDGDYYLLNTYNEYFINDNKEDRSFFRGDLIQIIWKYDSIEIADDNTKQVVKCIIATKKLKDGKLSIFKKKYTKQIKYWYSKDENYTDSYKNKLYQLIEYYLANSQKELVKINLSENNNLVYSIEQQVRNKTWLKILTIIIIPITSIFLFFIIIFGLSDEAI